MSYVAKWRDFLDLGVDKSSAPDVIKQLDTFFEKVIDIEIDPDATIKQGKVVYLSNDSSLKLIMSTHRAIILFKRISIEHRKKKNLS